jgi:hypothetical protein
MLEVVANTGVVAVIGLLQTSNVITDAGGYCRHSGLLQVQGFIGNAEIVADVE